jgi:hypothetical protein
MPPSTHAPLWHHRACSGRKTSDCYLRVRLGGNVKSTRERYVPDAVDADVYEAFEFKTTLPGPSTLTVECWGANCAYEGGR